MLAAAPCAIAAALIVAQRRESAYQPFTYTDLWMVPQGVPGSGLYTIGIRNGERTAQDYTVRLLTEGRIAGIWQHLALAPQQSLTLPVILPPACTAQAWLFRGENPATVYRKVSADSCPGRNRPNGDQHEARDGRG